MAMENALVWLFWSGAALVAYTYVGYGLLVYVLVKLRGPRHPEPSPPAVLPAVTLVVPAYNEAKLICGKLENTLQLAYPYDKLTVLFVTDGSNDGTVERLTEFPLPPGAAVQVLHTPERRGKLAAVERVMPLVASEFVVFSDANTLLNPEAVANLVKHYQDPTVGVVAGEKRVALHTGAGVQGVGEGLYWQYESTLKRLDAALYSTVGADGELFSIRTALYESAPADTIIEDFYLSLRIAMRRYRVAYAPDAYAVEGCSATVQEELKRKVRIAAGGLQAVARLPGLLNPFRYGLLSFQYISHRVLRWTLAPLTLPILFVINILLALQVGHLYSVLLGAQFLFYATALVGFVLEQFDAKVKLIYVPYYFCVMNYAVYAGGWRLLRGVQGAIWEKAERSS